MKSWLFATAAAGLIGFVGPAFSQSPAMPETGSEQAAPAQTQAGGMCGCCSQMMARMMQQGGRMGMQHGVPAGQAPMSPAPEQPRQ